jgi:hypothetical protein
MTKGLGRLYLGVYYVAEPAVFGASAGCAIATYVPTRASNAIVVINFRIMGLPSLGLSRSW